MPRVPYTKQALTFDQQLAQLKSRGLLIEDDAKALFLLEKISYFRLSGYWYPLLQDPKPNHQFKPNSSFNASFNLYCFDSELRKLVNSELEKIEIAIRAKMIYIISHQHGPFWFNNSSLFRNTERFNTTIGKLIIEYNRSNEDFITSFKNKYTDPLPPSWIIFEISSFGILSNLYKNLKPGRMKRSISREFGLDDSTFESWIHSIIYIRNLCAHHSRLWNKKLSISPTVPSSTINQWLLETTVTNNIDGKTTSINNKTYYLLSVIIYFLNTTNPKHSFKKKLSILFSKYPNVDPAAMGFTRNWQDEPLWQ